MRRFIEELSSIFMIFALATCDLSAQEPEITVTNRDGSSATGKILFADSSRLVIWKSDDAFTSERSADYSVQLPPSKVNLIVIQREGHPLSAAWRGFIFGAGAGVLAGFLSGDDRSGFIRFTAGEKAAMMGITFGIAGALIGGAVGGAEGINDEFILNGHRERYIGILPKLKEISMFRSAPPPGLADFPPEKIEPPPVNTIPASQESVLVQEPSIRRFHLSVSGSVQVVGSAGDDAKDAFNSSGFGGTYSGWFGPINYPTDHGGSVSWGISGEFSFTDRMRLGFAWNTVPQENIGGRNFESENTGGNSYSLLLTYVLSPADLSLGSRSEFAIAAGLSYNSLTVDGVIGPTSYYPYIQGSTSFHESQDKLGFQVTASYEYYFSSLVSLKCRTCGNIIPWPVDVPEVQYTDYADPNHGLTETLIAHSVNFSRLDFSLGLRFHF